MSVQPSQWKSGIGQQIEIKREIAVLKERALAPVSALSDMVRDAGDHDAGEMSHAGRSDALAMESIVWGLLKVSP